MYNEHLVEQKFIIKRKHINSENTYFATNISFNFFIILSFRCIKKNYELLLAFIWGNKPTKILKGGLEMPDIYTIHTTAKIKSIKRLMEASNGNWQTLFQYLLNIDKEILKKKLPPDSRGICLTNFHKQVFDG